MQSDLFDDGSSAPTSAHAPLAERMRPSEYRALLDRFYAAKSRLHSISAPARSRYIAPKQPRQYFGLPGHGPKPRSRMTGPPMPAKGRWQVLQRGGLGIERQNRRSRFWRPPVRRLSEASRSCLSPAEP